MTDGLCAKPGFAKRAETFDEVAAFCSENRTELGLNRLMIDKALALGTASLLSAQERCLMMALLSHLDIQETAANKTSVWPGAGRLCRLLEIGESTLRRLKASLEEKGFLMRRYDRRNRPLRDGALDLKPFLLKVPELLAALGHTEELLSAERAASWSDRDALVPNQSAPPPNSERAIIETLPEEISERSSIECDEVTGNSETLRTASLLDPQLAKRPAQAASRVFGEGRGSRLWSWAERRHGDRAVLGLAIATCHPKINNPAGWFGWFATTSADVDLEGMAYSILQSRPKAIAPADDPLLARLMDAFAEDAGRDAALSYLSSAQIVPVQTTLTVTVPSTMARRRLRERFGGALAKAAQALGFETVEVLAAGQDLPAACHESERRPDQKPRKTPARE
ncbi:MAG: hypothetical protein AAGH41_11390 [Pseudomonadota bacterium]